MREPHVTVHPAKHLAGMEKKEMVNLGQLQKHLKEESIWFKTTFAGVADDIINNGFAAFKGKAAAVQLQLMKLSRIQLYTRLHRCS